MQPYISSLKLILLNPVTLLLLFLIVVYFAVAISKYKKTEYYKATHNGYFKMRLNKGLYGEYLIYAYLRKITGNRQFLFNTYLPKSNGETTEVDVIMIHGSGIYVFESKNYSGWIFGKESQRQWTMTLPSGKKSQKFRFLNPIMQNETHIKWLKVSLSDYEGIPYHSVIVFSERCTLKKIELTDNKAVVIKRDSVKRCVEKISTQTGEVLSAQQVQEIYIKLYPCTQVSDEFKQKHIDDIKKDKPSPEVEAFVAPLPSNDEAKPQVVEIADVEDADASKRYCPKCGKEMVLRTAKSGVNVGKQFWGCSGFPGCRNVINLDLKSTNETKSGTDDPSPTRTGTIGATTN